MSLLHFSKRFFALMRLVLAAAVVFQASALPSQGFTDESASAGIILDHDGDLHPDILAQGSGAAWIDYNNDGNLDVYITMRLDSNRFYRNNGDGTFTDVTAIMQAHDADGDGSGVAVADFNNDGWEDIFLANCDADRLLKNIRGERFQNITQSAGFNMTDDSRGMSASWGDYDNDGYLDLYVVHHVPVYGSSNASAQDKLYHNNSDETFTDVSHLLSAAGPITGYGFIGGWTDYDNDHDLDLILINDCLSTNPEPTRIFRNDGNTHRTLEWNFVEISRYIGVDDCRNGMGIAVGDYNRDGWMDFYYSNIGECVLFSNNHGVFADVTDTAQVGGQEWPMFSWGTSFFDYDLDGWQDLFLVMGSHHYPGAEDPHPNQLFHNNGNGIDFTDVSAAMNMNDSGRGRNSMIGDYDNDGDPDMLLINYGEPIQLLRNNNNNGNHYLTVNLVGSISNRDGIGSRLRVTMPDGGVQYYETRSGSNNGGGEALDAYFGLGANTTVSELQITWPSGIIDTYYDLDADQRITLEEREHMQVFSEEARNNNITTGCGTCGEGNGLSFADFNGDGWDDLTFGTQAGRNILFYQNMNGTFVEIDPPVVNTDKNEQILWVDYDNDGDKDLLVTNFLAPNRLYNNDGDFNFTEVTTAAGLPINSAPTYGAVFGDYDNDGWLDLYIDNWSYQENYTNYLYHNNGDGTFTDVTEETGTADDYNLSFCSAFFDYNMDGWQDLYNSQDRMWSINTLFKNNGDGTFADVSEESNTDLAMDAMSVTVGDYDNDGDQDIYITNRPPGNALLRNNGDGTFTEVAESYGLGMYRVCWGAVWLDIENDMDLDLYASTMHAGVENASELYINVVEQDSFYEANLPGMTGDTLSSFGNAVGDFNNDGLPDIAVNNALGIGSNVNQFHLWENQSHTINNWIKIRLQGVESNREGIGSWIEIYLGNKKYVRYTHCGIGYLGQNSDTETIGLGKYATVDSIIVRWLSGHTNKLYDVAANQKLLIVEDITSVSTKEVNGAAFNQRLMLGDFYPNPSGKGPVSIDVAAHEPMSLLVTVLDTRGQAVFSQTEHLALGYQRVTLPAGDLSPGMYFVQFDAGTDSAFRKLIRVR